MPIDPFDEAASEQQFRALMGSPSTPVGFWARFVAFAEQPVHLRVDEEPDNDVLFFTARDRGTDSTHLITVERRIGLHVPPFDYCGTRLAACWLTVSSGAAWNRVTFPVSMQGHGASAGAASDVPAFRERVEASDVFAAFAASSLVRHVVSFGWS